MADMAKIRRNIGRLIDGGADEGEIETYLASEGVSGDQVAAAGNGGEEQPAQRGDYVGIPEPINPEAPANWKLDANAFRAGGGAIGTAVGAGLALSTGPAAPADAGPLVLGSAAIGAELAGISAEAFNEKVLGHYDRRGNVERALDTLANMSADVTFSAGGAQAVSVAKNAAKLPFRLLQGKGSRQAALDFSEAGISPRGAGGAITGNRTVQGSEEWLKKAHLSDSVMERARVETSEGIKSYAEKVIKLSGGRAIEKFTAGESLQHGLKSYFLGRKLYFERSYRGIRGLDEVGIDIKATKARAQKIIAEADQGLGDPGTIDIAKRILTKRSGTPRGDIVSFDEAAKLRSDLLRVGHKTDAVVADEAQAAGKQLSGAVDADMEKSVAQLNPTEFLKWRNINSQYHEFENKVELLRQITKSKRAQDAFQAAINGANDGPDRIKALKETIEPQLWDDFVGFKLRDMGLENAGTAGVGREFTPETYLTNWDKLTDSSKDVLFGKMGPLRVETDRLARIAARLRGTKVMGNPSGTGGQNIRTAQGVAIGTGITMAVTGNPLVGALTIAGATAGPVFGAKLMTSPRFVRWLANGIQISPANYSGMAAHIGRLGAIVKAQPDLHQAVEWYLNNLGPREESEQVPAPPTVNSTPGSAAQPTSQEEYDALASGSHYIDPMDAQRLVRMKA